MIELARLRQEAWDWAQQTGAWAQQTGNRAFVLITKTYQETDFRSFFNQGKEKASVLGRKTIEYVKQYSLTDVGLTERFFRFFCKNKEYIELITLLFTSTIMIMYVLKVERARDRQEINVKSE